MSDRWIASSFIRGVVAVAVREGFDAAEVEPLLREETIPESTHFEIWERMMRSLRRPDLPFLYARGVEVDDYDVLGLAVKTAPSLESALQRVNRYLAIWTNTLSCVVTPTAADVEVAMHREGPRTLGMRCANESTIGEVLQVLSDIISDRIAPPRVFFRHAAPADRSAHDAFFAGGVTFGADFDGFVLDREALTVTPKLSDPALSSLILDILERRSPLASGFEDLKAEIRRDLYAGVPKLEVVASRLVTSSRTLQRRLEDAGTTYRELADETRREIAERLLTDTELPLGEIAFLVGFSEVSAFHRAFKRWKNMTPGAFRAER